MDFFGTMFLIVPSMEHDNSRLWKVDQTDVATARQRGSKHMSMAKNKHITMEEPLTAVFSM
jgi:hypothetical protein